MDNNRIGKACIGFEFDDAQQAWDHMQFEIIKDYGDYAYGHCLHTWDDGKRMLAKCKACGGYVLIQKSEFHAFSDMSSDSYYSGFFPVESAEDAEELNRKFDGFSIEREFPSRYLCRTDLRLHWSHSETEEQSNGATMFRPWPQPSLKAK